jgi:transcriptional regulator with XRE-family HTH domain
VTPAGVALGARLRRHREQRGIALREVSDSTKIAYPLLEALERGDVSQWPQGIYRSGFIRAYAVAIGLPANETAVEFADAFDEPPPAPEFAPAAAEVPASPLRLTLAPISHRTSPWQRATVAALDVGIVVGAALLVSLPAGFTPWIAIACCALVYYAGSTVWQGRTPAAAWMRYDAGAAPSLPTRNEAPAPRAELAMTMAAADETDQIEATRERRSGTDRRRRPARPEPAHHGEGVGRLVGTPSTPSVH